MKLMIMGHARHGKDTVCEILRDEYNLSFESSSFAAARLAIYPALQSLLGYQTIEECYNDRVNHRALWHELIKAYNYHDRARLARAIYRDHAIYCGIRDRSEFMAARSEHLFDASVWVDASGRLPAESTDSCTVTPFMTSFVLDNNGTLHDLRYRIKRMMEHFEKVGVGHV